MRATSQGIPVSNSPAFRAPLAERSAVNRQVLGSIPSGGAHIFCYLCFPSLRELSGGRNFSVWGGRADAMAQWQRVGFQIRRLGVRIPLASSFLKCFSFSCVFHQRSRWVGLHPTPWRNGSASDSKSEGWGFESLWRQEGSVHYCFVPHGVHRQRNSSCCSPSLWPNWTRRLTTNQKIGGSSPSRDNFSFLFGCLPRAQGW